MTEKLCFNIDIKEIKLKDLVCFCYKLSRGERTTKLKYQNNAVCDILYCYVKVSCI